MMNKHLIALLSTLLISTSTAWAGDIDDADAAYIKKDYVIALQKYRNAAKKNSMSAQLQIGNIYYDGLGVKKDNVEALHWWKLAASQGSANAQFNVGALIHSGDGVAQDYIEALSWYKLAAAQGMPEAQLNIALIYEKGEGVTQNYEEAFRWFKLSAEKGNEFAQYKVGDMYDNGQGVKQDSAEAIRWLKLAAEKGYAAAQHNIALMYVSGNGVAQDFVEAARWFKLASSQGIAISQNNLAYLYANGKGLEKNLGEAIRWWKLAAAQGNASAQYSLANMYYKGEGVTKNASEAARWSKLAAAQGFDDALPLLGFLYANGNGVLQDNVRAHMWWNIAAYKGNQNSAKGRDAIATQMTTQQIALAQSLAQQCVSNKFKNCGNEIDEVLPRNEKEILSANSDNKTKPILGGLNTTQRLVTKRVALVIGNANYVNAPLKNPLNDATDISAVLKQSGFEVIDQRNATMKEMTSAIRQFGDRLINADVGLVYFSGHGIEVKGRNYLLPVNLNLIREDEISFQAIDVNLILEKMNTANKTVNILIIDACRDNPFARNFRSINKGLAQMDAPTGTIISFSTAPGKTAADGSGRNSPFTKNLVQQMKKIDTPIEAVFKEVRKNVVLETNGAQTPWETSSLIGDFY